MEEERKGREVDGERKRKVESWGREEGERNIQREGKERKGKKWIKVKKGCWVRRERIEMEEGGGKV